MGPTHKDSTREIIGVVGDVKQNGLDKEAPGILYVPAIQVPDEITVSNVKLLGMSWIVRTKSPRIDVDAAARHIFIDNSGGPLLNIEFLDQVVSSSIAQQRFTTILLCIFGLISLVLGAAGLYGVMSYTVACQTKEIGIRMAVGARRIDILQKFLQEASLLLGAGLIVGMFLVLVSAKLLRSFFVEMNPQIPVAATLMCGILLMTGLVAAWWPAKRAASTEPVHALRTE